MCHSITFVLLPSWSLYSPIEQLLSVRLESFFFAVLTIGEVMFTPRSDKVSLELGHQSHLLRHDRRMVLFLSQFRLPLNSKMPVWLSSCMWYLSYRQSNNKVIGQFITIFLDWPGCIVSWTVQGKVTLPSSTGGLILSQSYYSCAFMPFPIVQRNFLSPWWYYLSQRSVSRCGC